MAHRDSEGAGGLLALLFIVGGLGYWAYTGLRDAGYSSHRTSVNMYMTSDWLQNEERTCIGVQSTGHGEPQIADLFCPAEMTTMPPAHKLEVFFFGKTSRPELVPNNIDDPKFHWRCVRASDLLTSEYFKCYALD